MSDGITIIRPPDSFEVDAEIISHARRRRKSQHPDPIVSVEPEGKLARAITGILREINRNVDPLKKYKLEKTAMGEAMLGPLGKQKIGRITVHVPLPTKTQEESFTLWIPSELIDDVRIVRGLTVSLNLKGMQVPQHGYVWFCNKFEVFMETDS